MIRFATFPLNALDLNNESVKKTVIKDWMGIYELSGDRELMKLVYDTGLGGKNPRGLGALRCWGVQQCRRIFSHANL